MCRYVVSAEYPVQEYAVCKSTLCRVLCVQEYPVQLLVHEGFKPGLEPVFEDIVYGRSRKVLQQNPTDVAWLQHAANHATATSRA